MIPLLLTLLALTVLSWLGIAVLLVREWAEGLTERDRYLFETRFNHQKKKETKNHEALD